MRASRKTIQKLKEWWADDGGMQNNTENQYYGRLRKTERQNLSLKSLTTACAHGGGDEEDAYFV